MIHPTAVIHPDARLHSSVSVGAYAVIEGPAVIGECCVIGAHAVVTGDVQIGSNNSIGHGAVIGGEPQDLAFKPEVRSKVVIGNGNRFREHVTIHRGTGEGSETVVGDNCYLMAGAHLGHNVKLGNHVILANNVLVGGHVQFADRVFVGGGAVFHQFIRVGSHVICQGMSGFSKDIPPFTIGAEINTVAGLNIIGLRRGGFDPTQRAEIKAAFDLLYRSGLNVSQALVAADERQWTEVGRQFWSFIAAAKKKGICPLVTKTGGEGGDSE